ncbi:hypothetical protein PHLCEN_2v993 [Hermanssonia centrifuga]|uniref:Cytochrome b-c1 complex subunit Rieske transmembrane domain-containing protein n=1 Tax=Hermanssonia centrifuga TaxID=98765 RepID=A0A2R6S4A2_9APHY|nr:hypothetical protein PHLCEN_2v993 [Hermanssonia centrifuga]
MVTVLSDPAQTCPPSGREASLQRPLVSFARPLPAVCFSTPFPTTATRSYPTSHRKPAGPTTGIFQHRLLHTSVAVKDAPNVPDFSGYQAKSEATNRGLSYFMIGSLGVLTATAAKSTVTEFLSTMSASADVLALAKVEIELASIPEGKNVILKWRGKPVFIRHRTQEEIEEARNTDWKALRDPESDESRTKKPEWLVMLGSAHAMDLTTISLNLEIPQHDFNDAEGKLVVG